MCNTVASSHLPVLHHRTTILCHCPPCTAHEQALGTFIEASSSPTRDTRMQTHARPARNLPPSNPLGRFSLATTEVHETATVPSMTLGGVLVVDSANELPENANWLVVADDRNNGPGKGGWADARDSRLIAGCEVGSTVQGRGLYSSRQMYCRRVICGGKPKRQRLCQMFVPIGRRAVEAREEHRISLDSGVPPKGQANVLASLVPLH